MTMNVINDSRLAELLGGLEGENDFVFFDTSRPDADNRLSLLFTRPLELLRLHGAGNALDFLEQAGQWLDRGCYLAGWLAYELLHGELSIGKVDDSRLLAELGVYRRPHRFDHLSGEDELPPPAGRDPARSGYRLTSLRPAIEEAQYCRAIARILEYIAAGDTYQVNYTFKLHFDFDGSAAGLYRDLRRSQPVPYGCFMKHGGRRILSFSPELFFRMAGDRIVARPMKGTMRRGRFAREDQEMGRLLQRDEKNRSENVMIVDLLRNDLSRLVDNTGGGSVGVDSLFDLERYRTVFQMTSTITARRFRHDPVRPARILEAIFPCGSVTGAPKIRTMEIIDELEIAPRGVYTGGIGYFSPAGEAVFNVPIRTVVIDGGRGEMGIGSGIVADSSPADEWRECLLKARFLTSPPPPFALLETILWEPGDGYLFLDEHLARLQGSAELLGLRCDPAQVRALLAESAAGFSAAGCWRVRLTVSDQGAAAVESAACEPPRALALAEAATLPAGLVDLCGEAMDSSSRYLFHKTTRREIYDRAWGQARDRGLVDVLFCNERGEVTEGAITNVIVEQGGRFFTPPLECGLLPGVMRARLLAGWGAVRVEERVLSRDDVHRADRLFLCNSVRGVFPVEMVHASGAKNGDRF